MSRFLWGWEGAGRLDEAILEFTAGEDVELDRELFVYDLEATAAHVRGLARIGVLEPGDSEHLVGLLEELREEFTLGRFELDRRFEDGHSAIESWLTERAGPLGGRVHTGRSRNDQVAVAIRMYLRDRLRSIGGSCVAAARACLEQAGRHAMAPMPGYTHLQRAVPSSIGLWLGGFAESFTDDGALIVAVLDLLDACPLGSAAGYGVNLPLDRDGVAAELGFSRLLVNPLAAQNARGKSELLALQAAWHPMQDLRRFAWDLSLYTTAEFAFVRLPPEYATGSSIMPNKSNPDVIELMRARVATVEGAMHEIEAVLSLPSGYQRDLQVTKAPMVRGLRAADLSLAILPPLVRDLAFDLNRMRQAISPEMFATDRAIDRVRAGMPFRDAYREVKGAAVEPGDRDVEDSLRSRTSPGACGALHLDRIGERLERVAAQLR